MPSSVKAVLSTDSEVKQHLLRQTKRNGSYEGQKHISSKGWYAIALSNLLVFKYVFLFQ